MRVKKERIRTYMFEHIKRGRCLRRPCLQINSRKRRPRLNDRSDVTGARSLAER